MNKNHLNKIKVCSFIEHKKLYKAYNEPYEKMVFIKN